MGFIGNLFGSKKPEQRQVTNAKQLLVNDVIVFSDSFGLPELLRAQQFQVTAVCSYEYENSVQTEWTLTGASNTELYLSLDEDDKTYLKLSLKIQHADVEALFDLDQFSTLFDEPGQATLTKQKDTELTSQWSADEYHQHVFAQVGYFHRKDHRTETLSNYEGKDAGEQFELFTLYDADESKGIDVEVWEDGDTDVFLTLFRPTTDIVDMLPGS